VGGWINCAGGGEHAFVADASVLIDPNSFPSFLHLSLPTQSHRQSFPKSSPSTPPPRTLAIMHTQCLCLSWTTNGVQYGSVDEFQIVVEWW